MPRFKEAWLKKITSTKIWNKEGKAMVGWVFEYEDAEAYQARQSLWRKSNKLSTSKMEPQS